MVLSEWDLSRQRYVRSLSLSLVQATLMYIEGRRNVSQIAKVGRITKIGFAHAKLASKHQNWRMFEPLMRISDRLENNVPTTKPLLCS